MVLALLPSLSWGAGFALFEAGNKALGMGGAFTAVADDPSAMFWNPAGMAFQIDEGTQFMVGVTLIAPSQDFTGADPYPGEGYTDSLKDQIFTPPHFYWVHPLSDRVNFSLGFSTPFGLGTWWENEDFAGRYISKRADLFVFDLGGQVSWKICDRLAIGGGIDYMTATIELKKNIPFINPYTQSVTDVAEADLHSDGFRNHAWAWNAGFLFKLPAGFSIGGMYRSDFTVKGTSASAEFTQISTGYADFDAMVAAAIPFDEDPDIYTELNFPDYWNIGLAWSNEKFTVSGQYGVMGWSVFRRAQHPVPGLPATRQRCQGRLQRLEAVPLRYRLARIPRCGPSVSVMSLTRPPSPSSPCRRCFPMATATATRPVSVSSSKKGNWGFDVGYEYLSLGERSTEGRSYDGFDGAFHDGVAHLLGASFNFKF